MSKLSLCEINQSQLDTTPVIDGQLIVCLDTGNAYRDNSVAHVKIGSDLEVVSELPLAPLANKIYYLKPNKLYINNSGQWVLLNEEYAPIDHTHDLNKMIDAQLPIETVIPQDADYYIGQHAGGGDTTTTCYRRSMSVLWDYIKNKAESIFASKNHTHNYAGAAFPGGSATSAIKLDTATAGSATCPIYFSDGKPVACTYTLGKSVPSNAVFTDTKYENMKGATSSMEGSSGLVPAPRLGELDKFLKSDGTWGIPKQTKIQICRW